MKDMGVAGKSRLSKAAARELSVTQSPVRPSVPYILAREVVVVWSCVRLSAALQHN